MKVLFRAGVALTIATSAALGVASSRGSSSEPLALPGPATEAYDRRGREEAEAACQRCHADAARGHASSRHAHAFDDEVFQRGYAAEPSPLCRGCHAPESDVRATPDAFARTAGVACVTCHQPDVGGPVLASERAASGVAPHAVARVKDFGTRACASCHEFAFPGAEGLGERGLQQKTSTEHARSRFADRSCASCHMRRGAHGFAGSRDASALASALEVAVVRERIEDDDAPESSVLAFTLTPRGVGHALPTGDLFRELVVRVVTERGASERRLGRSFAPSRAPQEGSATRVEVADERLEGSRRILLPLRDGAKGRWEIVLRRPIAVGPRPTEELVASETRITGGELPP